MRNLIILTSAILLTQTAKASFFRDSCRHISGETPQLSDAQIKELKKDHLIVEHESIETLTPEEYAQNMGDFFFELCKVPYSHRKLIKRRGLETHLVAGSIALHPVIQGLTVGPRGHTTDWDPIPGVSAVSKTQPSIINIKSLYANHGSKNLVLHEFAHALDQFYNSYEVLNFDLSPSPTFVELSEGTHWTQLYGAFLVPYHKENPEEHFAELYARWYHNEETRAEARALVPGIESFIDSLLP